MCYSRSDIGSAEREFQKAQEEKARKDRERILAEMKVKAEETPMKKISSRDHIPAK